MEAGDVFALGLGLESPWKLSGQRLDIDKRPHELHLEVIADRGALFPCPDCSVAIDLKDTLEPGQVLPGPFGLAVRGIDIGDRRRPLALPRSIISGVSPELPGLGSPPAGVEHRDRGFVGEQLGRGQQLGLQTSMQGTRGKPKVTDDASPIKDKAAKEVVNQDLAARRVKVTSEALGVAHEIDALRQQRKGADASEKKHLNARLAALLDQLTNLVVLIRHYKEADDTHAEFHAGAYLKLRAKIIAVALGVINKNIVDLCASAREIIDGNTPYPIDYATKLGRKMSEIDLLVATLGGYATFDLGLAEKAKLGWEMVAALSAMDQNFGKLTDKEDFLARHRAYNSMLGVGKVLSLYSAADTQVRAVERIREITETLAPSGSSP
jgi:hypothetical protein